MDTPLHPSLKSKWVLLRVLTFLGTVALLIALAGIGLLAWMTAWTNGLSMSGPRFFITGASALAVIMLFWLLKALRRWFESEKELIFRASRILDLGSPKSCIISFPTAIKNKRNLVQLARLRETGPSEIKKSEWIALGTLTMTTPKADEEVLVNHDVDPMRPLVAVRSEKTVVIGFPVTAESWQEIFCSSFPPRSPCMRLRAKTLRGARNLAFDVDIPFQLTYKHPLI
jgi:hypothetical protein